MGSNTNEKKQGGFCFFKGEMVECIPGRVQDCNIKQVRKCIKDEQKEVKEKIDHSNGFCFCKGELVNCHTGVIQDCNMKQIQHCPLE